MPCGCARAAFDVCCLAVAVEKFAASLIELSVVADAIAFAHSVRHHALAAEPPLHTHPSARDFNVARMPLMLLTSRGIFVSVSYHETSFNSGRSVDCPSLNVFIS